MVIMKMNNVLVKHSKKLFAVFTGVIIISFVWFFTPGVDGSLLFGNNPNSPHAVVGKVFGENITRKDFRETITRRAMVMAAQYGETPDRFMEFVLENAFEYAATSRAAKHFGLLVSDDEVVRQIKMIPVFQENGKFKVELYDKYAKEKLEANGYTKPQFEDAIREALTVSMLGLRFTGAAVVTPSELTEAARSELEKYKARQITFLYEDFAKDMKVDDQDLLNYYNANKSLFMTEPISDAEIIAFFNVDFKDETVTDDEINSFYERTRESYKNNDGTYKPLNDVRKDVVDAFLKFRSRQQASDASKALREEIYTLADTAEYLADPEKSFRKFVNEKGLKLIPVKNVFSNTKALDNIGPEPLLISSILELQPRNPISRSIIGVNGSFIAFLSNRVDSVPANFDEIKEDVRKAKIEADSLKFAREKASEFVLAFSESSNPAKELETLVKSFDARIEDVKEFTRRDMPQNMDERTSRYLAMTTPTGKLSKPELSPKGVVLVFVDDRTQPTEEEIKGASFMFESMTKIMKQQISAMALSQWLMANTENYMVKPDDENNGQ